MKGWLFSALAVAPFAVLLSYLYDVDDWQAWALLLAAAWWSAVSRAELKAEDAR